MAVIVTIFAAKMVLGNTDPSKWRYSYLAKVTEPTEVKRGLCRYSVDAWDTLPLKVVRRQDRLKLESALNAAAPFTRMIAVVCDSSHAL